ncbi:DUF6455 family protein [Cognatishimia sp. SS12]|uniref:DUF6455 family protein n=1 Tax=Cognatishimia sp. SS12 TaxID=2979465 RepID=UPI00232B4605|nr:DUF6455 family protein [Cognatishimia sp. SS12]MDC0738156.1 DUF6455 family protein [Cognatishimia sp. SS12]
MTDRATVKKHAYLFDTMAQKLGHDMQQHALDGDIGMDELADAVIRCTGCSHPEDCAQRLAAAKQLTQTPNYCRNQHLFKDL